MGKDQETTEKIKGFLTITKTKLSIIAAIIAVIKTNENMFGIRNWVKEWISENPKVKQHTVEVKRNQKISGFLLDVYPYDSYKNPKGENPYNKKLYEEPVELFLVPLFKKGHFKVIDLNTNTILKDNMRIMYDADFENLSMMIGGWSGPTIFENNLNPYDKIGAMMAKKMGVPQPFKKKDYRTNTIKQKHWEELDEDQPDNTTDIDDYVANPDKVMNNAKKRRVNEEQKLFKIETLDTYKKTCTHVPDYFLTSGKKKINEEKDLRNSNALKNVKAKEVLTKLGIAFKYKPGQSGIDRVFITEPMKSVLSKIEQSNWEEYGKNPENTIRKWSNDDLILTVYAEGKDLPRATVITDVKVDESYKIRKVVPNSLDPYIK